MRTPTSGWCLLRCACQDPRGRDRLAEVSCRVLCSMKDEPADGRWKRAAPHTPRLEKHLRTYDAKVVESRVDGAVEAASDVVKRFARLLLRTQLLHLLRRKHIAARIRQQAIERPARVPQVKADRGGAAHPLPYMGRGYGGDEAMQIFPHLEQRMHRRHQQWMETVDWTAEPHLGQRRAHQILQASRSNTSTDLNVLYPAACHAR